MSGHVTEKATKAIAKAAEATKLRGKRRANEGGREEGERRERGGREEGVHQNFCQKI